MATLISTGVSHGWRSLSWDYGEEDCKHLASHRGVQHRQGNGAIDHGYDSVGWHEKALARVAENVTDAEYSIEKLTVRGTLVVGPSVGAGSVPAACMKLGRR